MNNSKHRVVVGDGFSASKFAEHVQLSASDRLTVVGSDVANLGCGVAFKRYPENRPWALAYLMNSPAAAFGAKFVDWLAANWLDVEERMADSSPDWLYFGRPHIKAKDYGALFAPRAFFGDFLNDIAQQALSEKTKQGVFVDVLNAQVTDIVREASGFKIRLTTGQIINTDSVDLAPGAPLNQIFGNTDRSTVFPSLYGFEDMIVENLAHGDTVFCIGANAAMLDILRFLQSQIPEPDISMVVVKRSEQLPEPLILHRPRTSPVIPTVMGVYQSARSFLSEVDREIEAFRKSGAKMVELRSGYYEWAKKGLLETRVPDPREQRKIPNMFESRFRRGTHDSLTDYVRLINNGNIREIQGEALEIHIAGSKNAQIKFQKADGQLDTVNAPIIINASGSGGNQKFDDLTTNLLAKDWLQLAPDYRGLALNSGLRTNVTGLRYISPAVTEVGETVLPFPLYDVVNLNELIMEANQNFESLVH